MEFDNNFLFAIVAIIAVLGFGAYKFFGNQSSHSHSDSDKSSSSHSSNNKKMTCDGDKCYV